MAKQTAPKCTKWFGKDKRFKTYVRSTKLPVLRNQSPTRAKRSARSKKTLKHVQCRVNLWRRESSEIKCATTFQTCQNTISNVSMGRSKLILLYWKPHPHKFSMLPKWSSYAHTSMLVHESANNRQNLTNQMSLECCCTNEPIPLHISNICLRTWNVYSKVASQKHLSNQ